MSTLPLANSDVVYVDLGNTLHMPTDGDMFLTECGERSPKRLRLVTAAQASVWLKPIPCPRCFTRGGTA